jgi:hypothetical protein
MWVLHFYSRHWLNCEFFQGLLEGKLLNGPDIHQSPDLASFNGLPP